MDTARLATDTRSLDSLRNKAAHAPKEAVKQAAQEFEALFMRQLLKTMRQAMPKSGMFQGPGTKMYEEMLDDQLAGQISGAPGGLGEMLAKHLSRYMADDAATPETAASKQDQSQSPTMLTGARASSVPAIASPTIASLAPLQSGNDPRIVSNGMPDIIAQSLSEAKTQARDKYNPRQLQFVENLWPHAKLAERSTGVPAEFVIGQAALESGWGRGEMRHADGRPAHNLFGIKAGSSWRGQTVDVTTTEYEGGKAVRRVETFRAYGSYAESFNDWASLMTQSPRYADVLKSSGTPGDFARGLQAAGYATDPRYGEKLERAIRTTMDIQQEAV